jgi:polyisoprenoid-binding protein YceI
MRWKNFVCGLALTSLLAAAPARAAERYELDPVHSYVGFAVRHMSVSWVKGEFKEFSGEILYDPEDISRSSVTVRIKAASLDTRIERRDNHLKSPDFFNVEQFPEITFQSKRVEKRGDAYAAIGDLTIRGVTKEIELPFILYGPVTAAGGRPRLGAEASTTLNRNDFQVSWNRFLEGAGLVVGDEARIDIQVEAIGPEPPPVPEGN